MKQRLVVLGSLVALALGACGSDSSEGYGKAGDAATADRTIDVRILATKKYDPAAITVNSGETVTFRVTNNAAELHEFMLGDQKVHDDHEKEMAGMSMDNMRVADKPNLIDLDPGQTKSLTWTFPKSKGATVIYGSHVPGDFNGGLKGVITVGEGVATNGAPVTTGAGAATTAGPATTGGPVTTMGDMGTTATTMHDMSPSTTGSGGTTATTMTGGTMPGGG